MTGNRSLCKRFLTGVFLPFLFVLWPTQTLLSQRLGGSQQHAKEQWQVSGIKANIAALKREVKRLSDLQDPPRDPYVIRTMQRWVNSLSHSANDFQKTYQKIGDPRRTNIFIKLSPNVERLSTAMQAYANSGDSPSARAALREMATALNALEREIVATGEGQTYQQVPSDLYVRPPLVIAYVSSDAGYGGDGSEENPFRTIIEALGKAGQVNALRVRIFLSQGTYTGDLLITRSTEIIGDETKPTILGSITNTHFPLTLRNIQISQAYKHALKQSGGGLNMQNCVVKLTRRLNSNALSGRAIVLSSGTIAVFDDVHVRSNQGQALYASGNSTKLTVHNFSANHNRIHPDVLNQAISAANFEYTGAVEIVEGATMLLEEFTIDGNEFLGVLVRNRARAHLRNGTISGTKGFRSADTFYGGRNLGILYESMVEVHDLTVERAELASIHIHESYLSGSNLHICDNPIGVYAIQQPETAYDFFECVHNLEMQNNAVNFNSVPLSIADPEDLLGTDEDGGDAAYCPKVPWE